VNQEAHLVEDSQSRLREPPVTAGRYSRSSYEDDDGRMQGGKGIATCMAECKIVNNVRTPEYSLRCLVLGPLKIGGLGQPCMVPITEFWPLECGSIVPSTTKFWVHKVMFDVIFH
jgi:hypothetical protein